LLLGCGMVKENKNSRWCKEQITRESSLTFCLLLIFVMVLFSQCCTGRNTPLKA
jgi:hypothetical protein